MTKGLLITTIIALLILPAIVLAGPTGDHPPDDLVFQEYGQYGVAYSTIPNYPTTGNLEGAFTISGIPSGSGIEKAFLYLNGVEISETYQGAGGTLNQNELPWRSVADYEDEFYFGEEQYFCTGYAWDVTNLISGNGLYQFSLSGPTIHTSAFLIVVYEHQDIAPILISIVMGEEILMPEFTLNPNTSVVEIPNIGAGDAELLLFGDGFSGPSGDEKLTVNGNVSELDIFSGPGQAFESGALRTVEGVNTIALTTQYDLLIWKITVLKSTGGASDALKAIEAKLDMMGPRIDNMDLAAIEKKLDDLGPIIEGIDLTVIEGKLDTNFVTLLEGQASLVEGHVALVEGHVALVEGQAELIAGQVDVLANLTGLKDDMAELLVGHTELADGLAGLLDGQTEILDESSEIEGKLGIIGASMSTIGSDLVAQFLGVGTKLDTNFAELLIGQTELSGGIAGLVDGQDSVSELLGLLNASLATLTIAFDGNFAELLTGQAELLTGQVELIGGVAGLVDGQVSLVGDVDAIATQLDTNLTQLLNGQLDIL
ncbi:MAG: hypothetical protein JW941_12170, partial [Candidatus Coatesbacteria bacterium]|nr:hypothetical protein [Candidatus Coatesbacteria bacterium]